MCCACRSHSSDLKGAGGEDLMQVRIGKFPQELIDPEIELRRVPPYALTFRTQLLDQAKRMQLAVRSM
jgi:hypothetical protein